MAMISERHVRVVLGFLSLFALQACSSIFYGSTQDLKIHTAPEGSVARVGTRSCITPCVMKVSRKEHKIFLMRDDVEREYRLTRSRNNFTFLIGNVLWGIFPGMIVDKATGANISLDDVFIILSTDVRSPDGRHAGSAKTPERRP